MSNNKNKRKFNNKLNHILEIPNEVGSSEPKITIVGFNEMLIENYKDANVIICSSKYADEIKCDLNALGIKDNQIFTRAFLNLHDMDFSDIEPHITGYERAFNLFDDDVSKEVIVGRIKRLLFSLPIVASPQPSLYYFDPGVIDLSENEIFVDGGMYIGDTAELFFNRVEKKYRHYYGFEPDKDNYYEASKNLAGKDNVTLINKGLWSSETHLSFSAGLATNSKLEVGGTSFVNVTALDVYFSNTRSLPTLIKMDIEGAEYEALLGAGHIICEQKPRLAICAYHKTEDIYVLPDLIKSYREDYKYYLRHYSSGIYGTVLYAV